jgi:hypothetical protein
MRYLSDQWLTNASAAVAGLDPLHDDLVVGYIVTDGPDGDRSYTVTLGSDVVAISPGISRAHVTMRLDWQLATEIAKGRASAQRSFLDGNLVLGGDVGRLLGHPKALGVIDDRLAELRTRTEFS